MTEKVGKCHDCTAPQTEINMLSRHILELQADKGRLTDKVRELEQQIEKMKNCKNCANYMISGKCPCFFRTGWCKNWEMAKGVSND